LYTEFYETTTVNHTSLRQNLGFLRANLHPHISQRNTNLFTSSGLISSTDGGRRWLCGRQSGACQPVTILGIK